MITCLTRPNLSDPQQMPFALCPSTCDFAHSLAERRFRLPIDIDLHGNLGGWPVMLDLQREQFAHDERFHREIARLSTGARLKHMALHFCKYTGQFATVLRNPEFVALRVRTITNSFIISLCSANSLNFDLSKQIATQLGHAATLRDLGLHLARELYPSTTLDDSLVGDRTRDSCSRDGQGVRKNRSFRSVPIQGGDPEGSAEALPNRDNCRICHQP